MDINKLKKSFKFKGEELTYLTLKDRMEVVKPYVQSSHKDRILMKDKETGNLYLYDFDEYVTYDSRGDLINELYVFVANEVDADKLAKQCFIKRMPYIWIQPDYTVVVEE